MELEKSFSKVCLIQSNCVHLYQKSIFNEIKTYSMGYIARNLSTNEVFYSKGANKIADKVGCNYSTITKFFSKRENKGKDKVIKEYIVSQTIDLANQNRGNNIKFNV